MITTNTIRSAQHDDPKAASTKQRQFKKVQNQSQNEIRACFCFRSYYYFSTGTLAEINCLKQVRRHVYINSKI